MQDQTVTSSAAQCRNPQADAARVAAFRERNGLPSLIDVHTHFMPERLLAAVRAYFDAAGPAWLRAVCHDNAARLFAR